MFLFHIVANKKISSIYFFELTSRFPQCLYYNQAFKMIYKGHMIDKMVGVYRKTFPVRSKK